MQRFGATNQVDLRVVRALVSHCWLVNVAEAREEDDWEFHHLHVKQKFNPASGQAYIVYVQDRF